MGEMLKPNVSAARRYSWWVVISAVVAWFCLWRLTPGLLSNGVGSLFSDDDTIAILIESILALGVLLGLVVLHRQYTRHLFAPSRMVWSYTLPIGAAVVLPIHYGLELPIAIYMFWMVISVFWQDYLTYGLLQKYLAERLPTWAVLVASAAIFWAGHALLLPEKFGVTQFLPSLAILALGLVLASLRVWLGTLHLILALHLTFYFVFA